MPSDKDITSQVPSDHITTTSISNKDLETLKFKVPLATSSSLQQQQQQQLVINKPTPPSTPPHESGSSQSPPQQSSNMTRSQGRRLSIDNSQQLLVPKTPDHRHLNNGFDSTPLQSPTKTPRSVKRRSTDIYNLLKTPDHKIHRTNEDDEDDEITEQTKKSSLELYKLLNTEDNKVKLVQQSPTKTTTIFNETSTSPVKNSYRVKKSDTEIKELSNNLKSRLNYAFMKVQHGWTEKPLSELEGNLELEKSPLKPSMDGGSPPREATTRIRPRPLSLHSPNPSTGHFLNRVRLDEFASSRSHRHSLSSGDAIPPQQHANANIALLSALSPRQPTITTTTTKLEVDPEKTLAMSLMKLSSPVKSSATLGFSSTGSTHSSPTKASQYVKPLTRRSEEFDDDEEDNKTETDIDEDDVVMGNDKSVDEF